MQKSQNRLKLGVLIWLACALFSTLGCGNASSGEVDDAAQPSVAPQPLAAGLTACPGVAVTSVGLWNACDGFSTAANIYLPVPSKGSAGSPTIGAGTVFRLRLASEADGRYSGSVRFVPSTSGEYIFYSDNGALSFGIRAESQAVELCGRSVSERQVTETGHVCGRLKVGFVAHQLQAGVEYTLDLGPQTSSEVWLLALEQREPGETLRGGEAACSEGLPDAALCAELASTVPLTAGFLGTIEPPVLTEGVAYGVHLRDYRGQNEGSLAIHAPEAGVYRIYLGTPHLGVALYERGLRTRLDPSCANVTNSASCDSARAVYSFQLNGRTDLRLDLTTPENETAQWVRVYVAHEAQPPASIPLAGLALWLQSDRGVSLDAQGRLTTWADQGPASNDAAPTTSARGPSLVENGLNGKPLIRFNGRQSLVMTHSLATPDLSAFFVGASRTDNPNASATVLGSGVLQRENFIRWQATQYLKLSLGSLQGSTIWTDTRTPHLSAVSMTNAGYVETYVNGTFLGAFGGAFGNAELAEIGAVAGAHAMQGDLAEVVVYSRALSADERADVQRYLLEKYAL